MSKPNDWCRPFQVGLRSLHLMSSSPDTSEILGDPNSCSPNVVAQRLEDAVRRIFLPTPTAVEWAQEILTSGLNHAVRSYQDPKAVLSNLYSPPEDEHTQAVYCLTGPAGVGKTKCLRALLNLILSMGPWTAQVSGHQPIDLKPLVMVTVRARNTDREILRGVLEQIQLTPATSKTVSNLLTQARACLYRSGTCAIVVDEMQFLATSATANAAITKSLLLLQMLGLPLFFVANYSLCHRLLRRNQEDKHRLLSRPRVMLTEDREGPWWTEYLRVIRAVAPHIFQFDPVADGPALHKMTMGLPRLLILLIGIAIRLQRGKSEACKVVRLQDFCSAYMSVEFSMHRREVELMDRTAISDQLPAHLYCPFEAVRPKGTATQRSVANEQVYAAVRAAALDHKADHQAECDRQAKSASSESRRMTRSKPARTTESLASGYLQVLERGVNRGRTR